MDEKPQARAKGQLIQIDSSEPPVLTELAASLEAASARPSGVWRFAPLAVGLLALAALLIAVVHFGEVERFADMARGALPEWMLLAVLAQCVTYVCAAAVWHRTLSAVAHPRSLASLLPLSVAKLFTDQAIPSGGFGGTLLVIGGLVRRQVPRPAAMGAVLVGMISYCSAYLLAAFASLGFLLRYHRASPVLLTAAALFSVVAVGIPATILWFRRLAEGTLPPWIRRRKGVAALLKAAAAAPADLLRRPMLLAETISLQLAIFLLDALTLWAAFRALAVPVDFWIAFTAFVSASMAATIGPIPLGLGTFEAGCLAVLGMLGVGVETALAATLLLRGLSFWLPMIPGLLLARHEIGRSQ
jgi:uncharacterized membrane protein YbhN (UPF0104 family)